jgi:serine/threonine protein phosphatase PrpC
MVLLRVLVALILVVLLVWPAVILIRRRRRRDVLDAAPSDTLVQLERATLMLSAAQRAGDAHTHADAFGFRRHPQTVSDRGIVDAVTAVIAEGTGDRQWGTDTSSTAAHVFAEALAMDLESGSPLLAALERAMRAANAAVLQLARELALVSRIGSTLAAVAVTSDGLHWVAAGGSRIYLWRRGALHEVNVHREPLRLTTGTNDDDRPLDPSGQGFLDGGLGREELTALDVSRRAVRLEHADRLVLCGAGVCDVLSASEIAQCVGTDGTAPAEELVDAAVRRQRPTTGTVTALVLTYDARDLSLSAAARARKNASPPLKLEHA